MATLEKRKDEIRTIARIAHRAVELARSYGVDYQHIDAMMDLENAHADCALDLDALLVADDGNFGHDVFGIRRHLNRQTRKLEDCFTPRHALKVIS